ncbi:Synaptonemal Complex Protein 3 [Manis pentadactyla]|nr:Synaptonemal Complex Protein 3 [Manis pentadactyla]
MQAIVELGLEGSYHVDERQGMDVMQRKYFEQYHEKQQQRQKHQSMKSVWYDQEMGWGRAFRDDGRDSGHFVEGFARQYRCRTSCLYRRRYLQMMLGGRNHLEKAEKASREAEDMAASDSGMQEWRELTGLEDVPEVEIKQAFLAKRRKFETIAKASIKTTNEKIEQVLKMQQERRQNLHLKYAQHLQPFLQEWDTDMQELQEQEEKPAVGISLHFKIS